MPRSPKFGARQERRRRRGPTVNEPRLLISSLFVVADEVLDSDHENLKLANLHYSSLDLFTRITNDSVRRGEEKPASGPDTRVVCQGIPYTTPRFPRCIGEAPPSDPHCAVTGICRNMRSGKTHNFRNIECEVPSPVLSLRQSPPSQQFGRSRCDSCGARRA